MVDKYYQLYFPKLLDVLSPIIKLIELAYIFIIKFQKLKDLNTSL